MMTSILDKNQALAIAALMEKIASVDGITPQERVLIDSFVRGFEDEFVHIKQSDWRLHLKDHAELAIRSAFVTAMCDGKFSKNEYNAIVEEATYFGFDHDAIQNHLGIAVEQVLESLAHIDNDNLLKVRARLLNPQ